MSSCSLTTAKEQYGTRTAQSQPLDTKGPSVFYSVMTEMVLFSHKAKPKVLLVQFTYRKE